MSPCKFYKEILKKVDEMGGGSLSSINYQQPTCSLHFTIASNEWKNCRTTPHEGPCWEMKGKFNTIKEWDNWVRNHTQD
jgi:hypothetical protein